MQCWNVLRSCAPIGTFVRAEAFVLNLSAERLIGKYGRFRVGSPGERRPMQAYFEVEQILASACSALNHLTKTVLFCCGTEMQCQNVLRSCAPIGTFVRAEAFVLNLSAERLIGKYGRFRCRLAWRAKADAGLFEVEQILASACSALNHLTKTVLFCGGTEMQSWSGSLCSHVKPNLHVQSCQPNDTGGLRSSWTLPVGANLVTRGLPLHGEVGLPTRRGGHP